MGRAVFFFLREKSSQEMKLTTHLCKMVNVWSYTSIFPYNFMACVLLKHILYMYGFVCVMSTGTVLSFLVTRCDLFVSYVHCISASGVNQLLFIWSHCNGKKLYLHNCLSSSIWSFLILSFQLCVALFQKCNLVRGVWPAEFIIWWDNRLLSELLHKIYLYHQKIMFLLILLFRNLRIKYWVGENEFKNMYELCTRWVSYWEIV